MGAIFVHVAVRDSNNCEVIKGLTSVGGSTIHLVAMLSVSNYIAIFFKMAARDRMRGRSCKSRWTRPGKGTRQGTSTVSVQAVAAAVADELLPRRAKVIAASNIVINLSSVSYVGSLCIHRAEYSHGRQSFHRGQ